MDKLKRIDRSEALRYMVCSDENIVEGVIAEYIDECEKRLLEVVSPKYLYKYFNIRKADNGIIPEGTNLVFAGNDIINHLEGCSGAVIIAATVGPAVDRLIRTLQVEDMTKAVIADALASAAVEQVCAMAEEEIKERMGEGRHFTWRYAPGYGDFSLDIQKRLLDVLDAPRKIGLCTSDSRLLTPIKSVTSVMGVSDNELPPKARGCITCNMREKCRFRKRGQHCGF